jgi:hypothetical protein
MPETADYIDAPEIHVGGWTNKSFRPDPPTIGTIARLPTGLDTRGENR